MSLLIKFIKENENWEELLLEKPYSLKINRSGDFVAFGYNLTKSDFRESIVREARGIVINERTLKVVAFPFRKFWNIGEFYADEINWSTAKVYEKIDGSIMNLWYSDGEWRVSTMSMPNAKLATIDSDLVSNFYELFQIAWDKYNINKDVLNKGFTYIFEVVSPYNKVVIDYPEVDIFHIGTRNNKTLKELDLDIGIKQPEKHPIKSLEEALDVASKLPHSKEGYVVVDSNWNRVKVKSKSFVATHYLKDNKVVCNDRLLEIVKKDEKEEFLAYFPRFRNDYKVVEQKYKKYVELVEKMISEFEENKDLERRDYAKWATNTVNPNLAFLLYDKKLNPEDYEEFIFKNVNYSLIKKL